jgi:hypothetical protein
MASKELFAAFGLDEAVSEKVLASKKVAAMLVSLIADAGAGVVASADVAAALSQVAGKLKLTPATEPHRAEVVKLIMAEEVRLLLHPLAFRRTLQRSSAPLFWLPRERDWPH